MVTKFAPNDTLLLLNPEMIPLMLSKTPVIGLPRSREDSVKVSEPNGKSRSAVIVKDDAPTSTLRTGPKSPPIVNSAFPSTTALLGEHVKAPPVNEQPTVSPISVALCAGAQSSANNAASSHFFIVGVSPVSERMSLAQTVGKSPEPSNSAFFDEAS